MGSFCTRLYDDGSITKDTRRKQSKFLTQDLHAPLFHKNVPEIIDRKANHKYCSPGITEKIAEDVDPMDTILSDRSSTIAYNESKFSSDNEDVSADKAQVQTDQVQEFGVNETNQVQEIGVNAESKT